MTDQEYDKIQSFIDEAIICMLQIAGLCAAVYFGAWLIVWVLN